MQNAIEPLDDNISEDELSECDFFNLYDTYLFDDEDVEFRKDFDEFNRPEQNQQAKDKSGCPNKITTSLSIPMLAEVLLTLLEKKEKILYQALWNNPALASYFSGKPTLVSVTNEITKNTKQERIQLPVPRLIVHFNAALTARSRIIINQIWRSIWDNPILSAFFRGRSIEVSMIDATRHTQKQEIFQCSESEWTTYLEKALFARAYSVINSLWRHQTYASYFSGYPVNDSTTEKTRQLPADKLLLHFRMALTSQNNTVIEFIWNNPRISSYLSGYATTEFPTPLITSELMKYFNAALYCKCTTVIQSMWGEANSPVQIAIRTLNHDELIHFKRLIQKNSKFIKTLLSTIGSVDHCSETSMPQELSTASMNPANESPNVDVTMNCQQPVNEIPNEESTNLTQNSLFKRRRTELSDADQAITSAKYCTNADIFGDLNFKLG